MGRAKSEVSIPSSYSADYFQRGKDYAEKLRRGCLHFFLCFCNEKLMIYIQFAFGWNFDLLCSLVAISWAYLVLVDVNLQSSIRFVLLLFL